MPKVLNVNIKLFCKEQKEEIKDNIKALFDDNNYKRPKLIIIQVGNNEASNRYIRNKQKDCEEVGIDCEWYWFEETITTHELVYEIKALQEFADAIIVQQPLPKHININLVKEAIDKDKDVDGFKSNSKFEPCTPAGIMFYLKHCDFDVAGKNVVIIGRSDIVGKPLAKMMTNADATVTLCHSKTKSLWTFIDRADLVVCAVGKPKFLNCYAIHVPIIDVGINFDENGKLVGDCFNTEHSDVTPVPGGVGLLTRLWLLNNVVCAAFNNRCRRNIKMEEN